MVSAAIAFAAIVSLVACGSPTAPRALEVGDVLRVDGIQLVGIPALGYPLSLAWGLRIQPPRVWFVDPRDAVAVSVRVGLRSLDVVAGCRPGLEEIVLPETLLVDGVRWSIDVALDDASMLRAVFEGSPGLLLVADALPVPNGAVRYRPVDADTARRALGFVGTVGEVEDASQWLDSVARGDAADLRVHAVLSVAGLAEFGECVVTVAELSSEGTTVWMAADRR